MKRVGARSRALAVSLLCLAGAGSAGGRPISAPEEVVVPSGDLRLRGLLWRPAGPGPFPAVLFNHGSGRTEEPGKPAALGAAFARHGYVFLFLYRRGTGLSRGEGSYSGDALERELEKNGEEARDRLQVRLLETGELDDALAGLAFMRGRPEVDPLRIAVAGHSFGGSLALLVAERDPGVRAVVDFAGAARSWPRSRPLRERLLTAVRHLTASVFIIHAANDYSVAPAEALGAELSRLGKPHRVRIYPAFGRSADEGHDFVYRAVQRWEADVFEFLKGRVSGE